MTKIHALKGRKQSAEHIAKRTASYIGKPLSAEHKKKLSKAWSYEKHITPERNKNVSKGALKRKEVYGYINSPEARRKLSNSRKGIKLSETTKEKIRIANLGKKLDKEVCLKMSKKMKGSNNPSWKGGVTPVNIKIRMSYEYKLWRESIFKRDNWTCIFCKQKGGKIQADHIKPFCVFPELRFAIDNGRTLCVDCHRKTDTYGAKALNFKKDYR